MISHKFSFIKFFVLVSLTYVLLHIPIFFLYPNHNKAVRKNIDDEFFHNLSNNLSGDCLRITKKFVMECPFPTREIHLNGEHTIVEIKINNKCYAYDPSFKIFFNDKNVAELSYDVRRNYISEELNDYPYTDSFKKINYYHNTYFILLNKISPIYCEIIINFYNLI